MGVVSSIEDNLKTAIIVGTEEFENMYLKMIEAAGQENDVASRHGFSNANEVEKIHVALYRKALVGLDKNENVDYHVCGVCGYAEESEAPDVCPVCGAPKSSFRIIN